MSTEHARVEAILQDDARLVSAVGAIVSQAADRAGMSEGAKEGFAMAAVEACRETFPLLSNNRAHPEALRVAVTDFHDRVEVTIEHSGEPFPTAGLHTFCGGGKKESTDSISKSLLETRVDRVQYESKDGKSQMTLIKYRRGDRAAV